MPTVTSNAPSKRLPRRVRRQALAALINPDSGSAAVYGEDLERLLSAGRAVGRARVYHTSHPGLNVLQAVLDGLRRL